jgi:hypothetical protein
MMTSTMMNNTPKTGKTSLPESMQRMITPQYEQIVNEIESIYHHPDTGEHSSVHIQYLDRSANHI